MFLSESIVRAIHADRVRDIERATRERRLVNAGIEGGEEDAQRWSEIERPAAPTGRPRTGRTGLPA